MRKIKMKKILVSLVVITMLLTSTVFAFTDTNNHWAKETINWGTEKGLINGYPDGTFKPNNVVTEAEFLAMLLRGYIPKLNGKTVNHWADKYYEFGGAGFANYPLQGEKDINKRNNLITRTQVAEVVAGTQGVNYQKKDAIHYLLLNGLAQGRDPNNITIANYDGDATLTRAEAVKFIENVLEHGNPKIALRPVKPSAPLGDIGDNDRIIPLVPVKDDKGNIVKSDKRELTAEDKQRLADYPVSEKVLLYKSPEETLKVTTQANLSSLANRAKRELENQYSNYRFIPEPIGMFDGHIAGIGDFFGVRGVEVVNGRERDIEYYVWYGAYLTDKPEDRVGRFEIRGSTALSDWR